MGPEGLEPSPNRLRAGRSAARTSIPIAVASRPGRSRTFATRLSAECSPVELQAGGLRLSRRAWLHGAGGIRTPPTGSKARPTAATPRPRSGHLVPGYAFDSDHRLGPRPGICQRLGASGLDPTVSSPRACGLARLSHALAIPASSSCGNRTHLSALKGRYPWPIDERASIQEWAGGRSNPRLPGFNRLLNRLSYRPIARFQQKSPVTSSHRA